MTRSKYFVWGIKEDGSVNLFFLKKRFLLPEEIESADTHFSQIDVFTKRFLNRHIEKNFSESPKSLRGNVINPKDKAPMLILMETIRVWVMCRYARTHRPNEDREKYVAIANTFFNGNYKEQRFQELKKEHRNDNPFKALERYRRQERQLASKRSSP